ncbi:hypothetical protein EV682_10429 [Iodobacter fluviatilis]|uniref:Uncharacterized protein n=1 Tax=Iodobacter fluviatilis TaxID=537 RepID=A0A377SYG5_9NEIS|nr:hypothetical protein EV682_10429 [Iodobacter fluviatilis]STR45366.1 Uncharacterised protein [Iodobacter fluviatilis]
MPLSCIRFAFDVLATHIKLQLNNSGYRAQFIDTNQTPVQILQTIKSLSLIYVSSIQMRFDEKRI